MRTHRFTVKLTEVNPYSAKKKAGLLNHRSCSRKKATHKVVLKYRLGISKKKKSYSQMTFYFREVMGSGEFK